MTSLKNEVVSSISSFMGRSREERDVRSDDGVFVSTVNPDEWRADPDVPGSEMHELVHQDGVWAGLTRILEVDGPLPWTPDHRETVHVLEGSVRIEFEDRPPLELQPGDIASFPAGLAMTWHVTTPFKELWFLA
jgi:ethanolamine utilization protein EutQ (cupin superfamily)